MAERQRAAAAAANTTVPPPPPPPPPPPLPTDEEPPLPIAAFDADDDGDETWASPILWLCIAWLAGSLWAKEGETFQSWWSGGGGEAGDRDVAGAAATTAAVGRPQLPNGHPPVPRGATELCSAALKAAHSSSWLHEPQPLAVAAVTAIVSVVVVIRRVLHERRKEKDRAATRERRAAACLAASTTAEAGGKPATEATAFDDWLAANTRRPTKSRPDAPQNGGNL
jgi:hypothetical protein